MYLLAFKFIGELFLECSDWVYFYGYSTDLVDESVW